MIKLNVALFTLSTFLANAPNALACTTMSISDANATYVAKSYDFPTAAGMAIVNPRNLKKTAFRTNRHQPAEWTSQYGSLTFNPWGREMPASGINEAGLVVETMWLQWTSYPLLPNQPTISELQWLQYQLDNFASVDEMIQHASEIEVKQMMAWLHYMACDRTGECATFEFLGGKMKIHRGLPYNALTNETYESSVRTLPLFKGFGGNFTRPKDALPMSRFIRAAYFVDNYQPTQDPKTYLNTALDSVHDELLTVWRLIHNTSDLTTEFRLVQDDPTPLKFDLTQFNFSCKARNQVWDLTGDVLGNRQPHEYSDEINANFVTNAYREMPYTRVMIGPNDVEKLARYPQTFECIE